LFCDQVLNNTVYIQLGPQTGVGTITENQRVCVATNTCAIWTFGAVNSFSASKCWRSQINVVGGAGILHDDQFACFPDPDPLPGLEDSGVSLDGGLEPQSPLGFPLLPSTNGLSLPGSYDSTGIAKTYSPAGCYGQIDYVHESSTYPGTVNVHGRAACNYAVPRLKLRIQLWEFRWWGWDRTGQPATPEDAYVAKLDGNASDTCHKGNYRGTLVGRSTEQDGNTYATSLESPHVNNPCRL